MKKVIAFFLALAAAVALGFATAAPASAAVTGGNLTNECISSPSLATGYTATGSFVGVRTCETTVGSVYQGKVNAFSIGSGCLARSQYSPAGAYPYKGGIKYGYTSNNLHLKIVVSCKI